LYLARGCQRSYWACKFLPVHAGGTATRHIVSQQLRKNAEMRQKRAEQVMPPSSGIQRTAVRCSKEAATRVSRKYSSPHTAGTPIVSSAFTNCMLSKSQQQALNPGPGRPSTLNLRLSRP
jgi:hypothetical protein